MIVTCPNCETQFNLDDRTYTPGRKARCSVCRFMFILPAPLSDGEDSAGETGSDSMRELRGDLDALLAERERRESAAAGTGKSLPDELEEAEARYSSPAATTLGEEPGNASGAAAPDFSAPAPAGRKGGCLKRLLLLLALLICLGGLGVGIYLIYFQDKIDLPFNLPFVGGAESRSEDPVGARIADIDKVKDLLLIDVAHKYVQNVKLGPLVVITGKVRNNFTTPKEMIRVEASLLDKRGKVLATQQQYCGIVVPDLQLQVLGQKELAAALDNRFDMLANNINVQPGAEVPFMVVFVYPPSNMAEYTVIVADVSDPPDLTPHNPAPSPEPGRGAGR